MNLDRIKNRRAAALAITMGTLALAGLAGPWLFRTMGHTKTACVAKIISLDENIEPQLMACAPPPPPPREVRLPELQNLKLIRTAKVCLEIQDYARFEASLCPLAAQFGYVSNIQVNQDEHGKRRATLTLRVDAERFEPALASFKQLGTVKSEEVAVEDVTRSYADLEARRANKRVEVVRLREIIQNRTGKLSDVIEAEQALANVTEELERMEAEKRTLDGQIALSTIHAEVSEPTVVDARTPPLWEPVDTALRESRTLLIQSLALLVQLLAIVLPWLLGLGLAWVIWRVVRARRRKEVMAES